jgi:transcription antitermination factor NusG
MGPTLRELCEDADLLQGSPPSSWFALTVKYQHERQVESLLNSGGVDTFLPLYRVRRRWSDRVKDLAAPLFPGYVFGRFLISERVRIVRTPGVARIVGFAGSPAPVPELQIESIRAALASRLPLSPWPYLKAGDRVRIERGPLRGVEGTLLQLKDGLRLILSVEMLQRSLAVEVESDMVGPN